MAIKGAPKIKPQDAKVKLINADEFKFPDTYYTVRDLMRRYGDQARLVDILNGFRPIGFKCPQCEGRGVIDETYNAYPPGLPDSGWGYREGHRDVKCPLCDGTGAVPKKMKPHMVQDGWVEET